jgi:hypothetical protein
MNKMNMYTRKELPVIGPEVQSVEDGDGKELWLLVYSDGRTSNPVVGREALHKWIRDHGFTRFKENGEWKIYPEDPTYPEAV